jgi:putative membrane protein insertion efficiency factor
MGHSDSSAHVSGYGGVCGGDERVAEASAEARSGKLTQDLLRGTLRSAGKWVLLLLVRLYQVFLSPFFGGACKFYPSCSRYGYEAIAKHGAWSGSVLAVKRLLRCRPFTKGGFDPVPDVVDEADERELQGLKPHCTRIVNVAAEAATYKDQGRPFANDVQRKHFANGTQGKRGFAQ